MLLHRPVDLEGIADPGIRFSTIFTGEGCLAGEY
jgi:hypothetical protein